MLREEMTDTVEAVARALTGYVCQQSLCSARLGWKDDDKNCPCRQAARAAIAAMPKPEWRDIDPENLIRAKNENGGV